MLICVDYMYNSLGFPRMFIITLQMGIPQNVHYNTTDGDSPVCEFVLITCMTVWDSSECSL